MIGNIVYIGTVPKLPPPPFLKTPPPKKNRVLSCKYNLQKLAYYSHEPV